jgi:hypothetical protein
MSIVPSSMRATTSDNDSHVSDSQGSDDSMALDNDEYLLPISVPANAAMVSNETLVEVCLLLDLY